MLTAMTAVDNIINGRRESARLRLPARAFQDSSRAPAPVSSGHRGANCIRLARRPNITCYHLLAAGTSQWRPAEVVLGMKRIPKHLTAFSLRETSKRIESGEQLKAAR